MAFIDNLREPGVFEQMYAEGGAFKAAVDAYLIRYNAATGSNYTVDQIDLSTSGTILPGITAFIEGTGNLPTVNPEQAAAYGISAVGMYDNGTLNYGRTREQLFGVSTENLGSVVSTVTTHSQNVVDYNERRAAGSLANAMGEIGSRGSDGIVFAADDGTVFDTVKVKVGNALNDIDLAALKLDMQDGRLDGMNGADTVASAVQGVADLSTLSAAQLASLADIGTAFNQYAATTGSNTELSLTAVEASNTLHPGDVSATTPENLAMSAGARGQRAA